MAHIIASIDEALGVVAKNTGFPLDQVRYVVCMLLMIVAAIPYRLIPGTTLKHIFSIVISIVACMFCLGAWSWLHSFGTSLVVYLLMLTIPKYCHIISFIFCFAYISGSHIYRQYVDYMGWTLDFTGPQMVVTLKLVSIAFCYHDGLPGVGPLNANQQKKALKSLPSILEYFGYVYFYPSFLAGPTLDFAEYKEYLNKKMFDDEYCKGQVPSTILPTIKIFLRAIFCMVVLVVAGGYLPMSDLTSRNFHLFPQAYRVALLLFGPSVARFKYYFGWLLAETAFVACGISYNGLGVEWQEQDQADGKPLSNVKTPRWDRVSNVRIAKVEFGQNIRDVTVYWNYCTGKFLREYVYDRVPREKQKGVLGVLQGIFTPTLDVFLVSAFWHGFYPGYYMFFVYLSVQVTLARDARRWFRPKFLAPPPLKLFYDFCTFAVTSVLTGYSGVAFLLMSWENIVRWYGSVHWYGHWALLVAFIIVKLLYVIAPPRRAEVTKKEQ